MVDFTAQHPPSPSRAVASRPPFLRTHCRRLFPLPSPPLSLSLTDLSTAANSCRSLGEFVRIVLAPPPLLENHTILQVGEPRRYAFWVRG